MPDQSSVIPDTTSAPRNPLCSFALTRDDVEPHEAFLVYNIVTGLQPRDEFLTAPFVSNGWWVVNTRRYPTAAKSLVDFGIVPGAGQQWSPYSIAVANTPASRRQLREWLRGRNSLLTRKTVRELDTTYPND